MLGRFAIGDAEFMSDAIAIEAGVVALVAVSGAVASLTALHIAPTGLSPVRNAVSPYGIIRFRIGYRTATVSLGIAGLAIAAGLVDVFHGDSANVVTLLVVFAVARLVICRFPMDAPDGPPTRTGRTHGLVAVVALTAVTLAALRFTNVLSGTDQWGGPVTMLRVVAWFLTVSLVAMVFGRRLPRLRSYFGAIERAFYVGTIAWLTITAIALITTR